MPYKNNIVAADGWFTGTDQPFEITVYQRTATDAEILAGTGTAQNISGWSLSWMLKKLKTDEDSAALITKTTLSGIVLTDAVNGVCTVTVDDVDTDALVAGLYHHELKRTDAGFEAVLTFGTANLQRSVHHA